MGICPTGYECSFDSSACDTTSLFATDMKTHDGSDCLTKGQSVQTAVITKYPDCSYCTNWSVARCDLFVTYVTYCSQAVIDATISREIGEVAKTTVTGVEMGNERTAAELAFTNWSSSVPYPVAPTGTVRTDGLAGLSYVSTMAEGETTATVEVQMWKRGQYTKTNGNVVPLENIAGAGGGSGGTAIDYAQMKGSVYGALVDAGLTKVENIDAVKQGIINSGLITAVQAIPGGGGSTIDWSQYPGVKPSDLSGVYSGGNASGKPGYSYTGVITKDIVVTGLSGPWNDFTTKMKTTGLFGSVNGFFSGAPSGGSPGVIQIDGGHTFGSHTFDFNVLSPALAIFKGIVLVIFSFVAVKSVVLKGGG